jgi:hypothetical protein
LKIPLNAKENRSFEDVTQELQAMVNEWGDKKEKIEAHSMHDPIPEYKGPDFSIDDFLHT